MLNQCGYPSAMVFMHDGNAKDQNYKWAISNSNDLYGENHMRIELDPTNAIKSTTDFLENGIIIYPDMVHSNPIHAKRVVRYILGPCEREYPGDYILNFSASFRSTHDHVLYNVFPHRDIHSKGSIPWHLRSMDATYFGKGPTYTSCHKIPDSIIIERDWPSDKNQLGILLRHCRFLFTWDTNSATNLDAIICGAVPVFMNKHYDAQHILEKSELGSIPRAYMEDPCDKSTITYDFADIKEKSTALMNRYNYYIDSWAKRTEAFAKHCCDHFNI